MNLDVSPVACTLKFYDRNDCGQNYKTTITIIIYDTS
jgi:hypothetical protein